MRFMMFMYPGSDEDCRPEADVRPMMAATTRSSRKAGVLLALDGLQPPDEGRPRDVRRRRRPTVTDGPFAEAKEVVGGYWIIQARSKEEAVEWASRCPAGRAARSRCARSSRSDDFPTSDVPPSCRRPRRSRPRRSVAVPSATQRAIDAVWRIESPRLIAGLARMVRDVGLAEDLAQDALVAALEQWPESGVPDNPGAWLMATAKNRAIDLLRRGTTAAAQAARSSPATIELASSSRRRRRVDDEVGDDLLGLIFTCCHPVLSPEARVALTLRLLGGLTTDGDRPRLPRPRADGRPADRPREADARARRNVPFEVPARRRAARARLASVLEVDLPDLQRGLRGDAPATTGCARRCARTRCGSGRILAELAPREPEVHGLVALMEIQASRLRAPGSGPAASRSCCSTRTARAGTGC